MRLYQIKENIHMIIPIQWQIDWRGLCVQDTPHPHHNPPPPPFF